MFRFGYVVIEVVFIFDEALLQLLFRGGLELNPGPRSSPNVEPSDPTRSEPRLSEITADIVARGRARQRGGRVSNAGRGRRATVSLRTEASGNRGSLIIEDYLLYLRSEMTLDIPTGQCYLRLNI